MENRIQFDFREVDTACLLSLRHQVLRTGLPIESACFPGDDEPSTRHFALFINESPDQRAEQVIGCASFMLNEWEGERAWQLRGMAIDTRYQNRGLGRNLLTAAEKAITKESPIRLFWCNARLPAVSFYEAQGWTIASDIFIIPDAGPHRRMTKRLPP